jgi:hypothetical protein
MLTGLVWALLGLGLACPAQAAWVHIETLVVDGVNNALPGGTAICNKKTLGPGQYKISIDPKSVGISYNTGLSFPYVISAGVMFLDDGPSGRQYHFGLNIGGAAQPMTRSATVVSKNPAGICGFVEDGYRHDNAGSVILHIYQWQ